MYYNHEPVRDVGSKLGLLPKALNQVPSSLMRNPHASWGARRPRPSRVGWARMRIQISGDRARNPRARQSAVASGRGDKNAVEFCRTRSPKKTTWSPPRRAQPNAASRHAGHHIHDNDKQAKARHRPCERKSELRLYVISTTLSRRACRVLLLLSTGYCTGL